MTSSGRLALGVGRRDAGFRAGSGATVIALIATLIFAPSAVAVDSETETSLFPPTYSSKTGPSIRAEQWAWFTKLCIASIPGHGQDTTAREWVEQAIAWWLRQDNATDAWILIDSAKHLQAAQRDCGTVQLLLGMLRSEWRETTKDRYLLSVWPRFRGDPSVPEALRWCAGAELRSRAWDSAKVPLLELSKESIRALIECLKKECLDEREQWLATLLPQRGATIEVPFYGTGDYDVELAEMPAAIRDTFIGMIEIDRAWIARGGGWASSVSPKGWTRFSNHLALARAALTRAYEAAPDQPHAAASMLTVCKGESAGEDELRLWLRRALSAQRDCFRAWINYMDAELPRWGGSVEAIEHASLEAVLHLGWDTDLPFIYDETARFIRTDAHILLVDLYAGGVSGRAWKLFLDSIPPRPIPGAASGWEYGNVIAFNNATTARRFHEARAALDRLGDNAATVYRRISGISVYSFELLRTVVLAHSGEFGDLVTEAEEAQEHGHLEEAIALFAKAVSVNTDPVVRSWIETRSKSAAIEASWKKGEPVSPDMSMFFALLGSLGEKDGAWNLSIDGPHTAYATAWLRSSSRWELEVTFDVGDQTDVSTGIYWGQAYSGYGIVLKSRDASPTVKPHELDRLNHHNDSIGFQYAPLSSLRSIQLRWDGHDLKISAATPDVDWEFAPKPIDTKTGLWMLSLLVGARGESGPAKAAITGFKLRPLDNTPAPAVGGIELE